ncbi:Zn-dependent hydrolase [Zhengella mangrovi]|uniref:Zn-dependent hydrolase n=1 Tax=Zhengella mangrovi TaxID=1982044 RepID=A0A2G1QKV7_9HYPH|nr:MBL fold metallo-hydrolase [Zhengella mangrovi]PHP66109.1 Zn-dependent hydrolase [Zhengella mangrovi]
MPRALSCLSVSLLILAATAMAGPARAQSSPAPSKCMAIAQDLRQQDKPVRYASLVPAWPAQYEPGKVTITYAGHSTYVIETPAGVRAATDFSGYHGYDPLPRVVTMNRAHSTHYTMTPDPGIEYVLPGWKPDGSGPAEHRVVVDDLYIRNVPTDIRMGDFMMKDGNSIFIFEVADLCIGHLGHLHHDLTDAHYAAIGRLDILMVPIDGGLTLSHEGMAQIVRRLQSSIVLPMHRRYTTMERFLSRVRGDFAVEFRDSESITVSIRDLPRQPTIVVLKGV